MLGGMGDKDLVARLREKPLDPGTVRTGLEGDACAGILLQKTAEGFTVSGFPQCGMDRKRTRRAPKECEP
jgi:hypothetical protein